MAGEMVEAFEVLPFRFHLLARETLEFPPGGPSNLLRGAFGSALRRLVCVPRCKEPRTCPLRKECPYARIFEPGAEGTGPSGLASWPRPFVFRAQAGGESRVAEGADFSFDVHLFDVRTPLIAYFVDSFALAAKQGLGRTRGRASLTSVDLLDADGNATRRLYSGEALDREYPLPPVVVDLSPAPAPIGRILVRFLTPTELKGAGSLHEPPEFDLLLARARDRVSTLRLLYGGSRSEVDFKALGARAAEVRRTRTSLSRVRALRRSSKTGQVHPLDGFIGEIEYEGDLGEFLPYLQAARWTGVGRQTVWGKGAIETAVLATRPSTSAP
jgi:hypothetical protein